MRHVCARFPLRMFAVAIVLLSACAAPSRAQFGQAVDSKGAKLDKESVQQYEIGVEVTAEGGPCNGIVATTPMPIDWPEQRVRVMKEDISPFVRGVTYRTVGGTVKQMVINIPHIPAGETVRAVVTLEISRHSLLPPENTSGYVIPKKLDRETRDRFSAPAPRSKAATPRSSRWPRRSRPTRRARGRRSRPFTIGSATTSSTRTARSRARWPRSRTRRATARN